MANVRPKVDAVIVGLGWCGSLIAEELTRAGLNVVAIERGPWFETATDFPPSVDTDELRWDTRRSMLLPPAIETTTFRTTARKPRCRPAPWNATTAGATRPATRLTTAPSSCPTRPAPSTCGARTTSMTWSAS